MLRKIIYLLLLLSAFKIQAQDSLKYVPLSIETLKQHVYNLAADSMMGRGTGQLGQRKAAIYCLQEMKKLNLIPTFSLDSNYSYVQNYFFDESKVYGMFSNSVNTRATLNEGDDKSKSNTGQNLSGLFVGSELKNEFIIVSAHYDHLGRINNKIFHGADDNASGTATVLAIAERISQNIKKGIIPKRTILFLLVSGEEKGLLGSSYFVKNSPFNLNKYVCDINIDMVGRVDRPHRKYRDYVYLIDGGETNQFRNQLISLNEKSYNLEIDQSHNSLNDPNQYYYRSDHFNFAKNGVPILFFMDGEHPDYHQVTDTADKIEYDVLQKRASLIFEIVWELANQN